MRSRTVRTVRNPANAPYADLVSYRAQLLASLFVVLAASFWLANLDATAQILGPDTQPPIVAALIATGPLSGWLAAVMDSHLPQAAGFLVAVTAVPLAPILTWAYSQNPSWLCLATPSWLAAGYFCSVAIWL